MGLPKRMSLIYNIKHCYAIRLKFGEKYLTFLNKFLTNLYAKQKPVSAMQSKKIYFYIVVISRQLLLLS